MQQNKLSTNVSRDFWKKQGFYPAYGDIIKKRRFHEVSVLTDWIWKNNPRFLADIGCGNGSTVTILQELTDIEKFYCYDISPAMLDTIAINHKRSAVIHTNEVDLCKEYSDFASTDLTTILGVTVFLTDEQIIRMMSRVHSSVVILRDPTSETHEEINKYSEGLNAEYSAAYRTIDESTMLYQAAGWTVLKVFRAFPDEIESEFGTKQYFWICKKEINE